MFSSGGASPPLPELLSLTLSLHDGVRCPGSSLAGRITVHAPTKTSLRLLHDDQQQLDAPATPTNGHTRGASNGSGASMFDQESASLLGDRSSATAPLSRPFPFELRLQLLGKALVDDSKVSPTSIQRFRPAQAGRGASSFKMWSTRVIALPVLTEDAVFPRTYEFCVTLPDALPPSFRGSALTHLYFVQVVALAPGGAGKKLLDLKVPFRVRVGVGGSGSGPMLETPSNLISSLQHCLVAPVPSMADDAPPSANLSTTSSTPPATPISSVASSSSPDHDASTAATSSVTSPLLGTAIAIGTTIPSAHSSPVDLLGGDGGELRASSSRRNSLSSPLGPADAHSAAPLTFNISKTVSAPDGGEVGAHVVKLTLDQRFLRPGDTLRGHLDFSRASIRCYRVAISLQQEERVSEDCARPGAAEPYHVRKSFANFHAYTVNTLSTHFLFCLPLDAVSNFSTDVLSVTWSLRFKFVTDVDAIAPHAWSFLPAAASTHAEALLWTLPLTVLTHDDADALRQKVIKTVLFSPSSFV